ncbi:MAG: hypothetical protein AAGA87_11750 [Pseudomonadota bacterium]
MTTPWHIWVVGLLALVWSAGGAADFVLTWLGVEAYTSQMPQGLRTALENYPPWMTVVWGAAVLLPVLGALLLLGRIKAAAYVLGFSTVLVIVAGIYNFVVADPPMNQVAGNSIALFWAGAVAIATFLWLYAREMAMRGVLE